MKFRPFFQSQKIMIRNCSLDSSNTITKKKTSNGRKQIQISRDTQQQVELQHCFSNHEDVPALQ